MDIKTNHKNMDVKVQELNSKTDPEEPTEVKTGNTEGDNKDGEEIQEGKEMASTDNDVEDGLNRKRRRPTLRKGRISGSVVCELSLGYLETWV